MLLADASDAAIIEYSLSSDMVVVTFDPDLTRNSVRKGCAVLWIEGPELTARVRTAQHYRGIVDLFASGAPLVTLPEVGAPIDGRKPPRASGRQPPPRRRVRRT